MEKQHVLMTEYKNNALFLNMFHVLEVIYHYIDQDKISHVNMSRKFFASSKIQHCRTLFKMNGVGYFLKM